MHRGTAGVCVLAALVAVGVVSLAGVTGPVGAAETPDNGTERAENASLGTEISSFMQASSAETERNVEDGRFEAAMSRTDDEAARQALVEERLAGLEERHEQLRTRREELGDTPDVRNRSIATRVAVGASGLERSLDGTERAAAETGVDDERVAELRSNASAMTGPEVAELARGLAGPPGGDNGPPEGNGTGPPGMQGPPDGNASDSTPGSGAGTRGDGPPDDATPNEPSDNGPGASSEGDSNGEGAGSASDGSDPEGSNDGRGPSGDGPSREGGGAATGSDRGSGTDGPESEPGGASDREETIPSEGEDTPGRSGGGPGPAE